MNGKRLYRKGFRAQQSAAVGCASIAVVDGLEYQSEKKLVGLKFTRLISIMIAVFFFKISSSQNLVINPSFENFIFRQPPFSKAVLDSMAESHNSSLYLCWNGIKFYNSVDMHFSDLQNFKDTAKIPFILKSVRNKYVVNQTAQDGFFFASFCINYEMVIFELRKALDKDSIYNISFYIQFNSITTRIPKVISFVLSEEGYIIANYLHFGKFSPRIKGKENKKKYQKEMTTITLEEPNNFVDSWVKVEYKFKAKGGEKYLHFFNPGRIKSNRNKKFNRDNKSLMNGAHGDAYMGLDNVCVSANGCNKKENNLKVIKVEPLTLKPDTLSLSVSFNLDRCDLLPVIENELVTFFEVNAKYFDSNFYNITVIGHTDTVGDLDYNYQLGLCRANTVAEFIATFKPDAKIEAILSFGETRPLLDYNFDAKTVSNRRVEFIFKHKGTESINK